MYSTQRVMKVVVVIKESSLVDASKHMVLMCSVGIAVKGNWVGLDTNSSTSKRANYRG